jgi:hypothetical protein
MPFGVETRSGGSLRIDEDVSIQGNSRNNLTAVFLRRADKRVRCNENGERGCMVSSGEISGREYASLEKRRRVKRGFKY